MSIKFLEKLISSPVVTKEAKFIIELLLNDERKHHELLTKIYQVLVEGREFP